MQSKLILIFWRDLPWHTGGKQLWNFIKKYDTEILSAYVEDTYDKNCIPGKKFWATKNLGIAQIESILLSVFKNNNSTKTQF